MHDAQGRRHRSLRSAGVPGDADPRAGGRSGNRRAVEPSPRRGNRARCLAIGQRDQHGKGVRGSHGDPFRPGAGEPAGGAQVRAGLARGPGPQRLGYRRAAPRARGRARPSAGRCPGRCHAPFALRRAFRGLRAGAARGRHRAGLRGSESVSSRGAGDGPGSPGRGGAPRGAFHGGGAA